MKKNILVVQALLCLPLMSSSMLLSMNRKQKETPLSRKQRKQNQLKPIYQKKEVEEKTKETKQPVTEEKIAQDNKPNITSLLEDIRQSKIFIKQSQLNASIDESQPTAINPVDNSIESKPEALNLVTSEIEIINLPLPERTSAQKDEPNIQLNSLLESVILPTQEKELSFVEKLNYYTSTASQILQRIISELETGKFNTEYKTSFDLLEEAITTATKNNDVKALATIASLCHTKYPTTIRISEKTAQPASELLKTHYTKELLFTNNALQNKHEEKIKQWNMETAACMASILTVINAYQNNIKSIYGNYDESLNLETERIKNLRRDVSIFSSLNKEIRPNTAELLTQNQLKTPNNIHATTMHTSEKRFESIRNTVNDIPTIKGSQTNPQYLERLTNK